MSKHFSIVILAMLLAGCKVSKQETSTVFCDEIGNRGEYAQANAVIKILDQLLDAGVPGVAISIHSKDAKWNYAAGYAKLEDKTPMQPCHLHFTQSIAKTYMAAIILMLRDQGEIDLNISIDTYLPLIREFIPRANEISVKMLLNHTSGIPEYNSNPYYLSQLLQDPTKDWDAWDYLEIVKDKPLLSEPGTRYRYCNLTYEILALIADEITGDHAKYMSEKILIPLGLTNTFYRNHKDYLNYDALYNGYWDRFSNGILENVTVWERQNVSDMIGDDGIVSTPEDAVVFLKNLLEGKIISQESLDLMMQWVLNKDGEEAYGLGLDIGDFIGYEGIGHSGGGLAAGSQLYYFHELDLYFFIGINLGTITEGPIHEKAVPLLDELYEAILGPSKEQVP